MFRDLVTINGGREYKLLKGGGGKKNLTRPERLVTPVQMTLSVKQDRALQAIKSQEKNV